jgi:hypothetical protein
VSACGISRNVLDVKEIPTSMKIATDVMRSVCNAAMKGNWKEWQSPEEMLLKAAAMNI